MGGEARRPARGTSGAPRRTTDDPPGRAHRRLGRPRLARRRAPARGLPVHVSGPPPVPGGRTERDREAARREREAARRNGGRPRRPTVPRSSFSVPRTGRNLWLAVIALVALALLWF